MADPRKWKEFERLVAAIHAAADQGAHVQWDQKIRGRQFDVVIQFKKGMYEYTTAIECKNYSSPVPVEKVDAFITKCHDCGINYGVLASSSGFQEGATNVAERHHITLLHITENHELPLLPYGAKLDGEIDVLHIEKVSLKYHDGVILSLPEEANALTYYVNHIIISNGGDSLTLDAILTENTEKLLSAKKILPQTILCPANAKIVAPSDGEIRLDKVAAIIVDAGPSRARVLKGPYMFEPYLLTPDITVKNVRSGEEQTFSQVDLPHGFDTKVEVGKFYENKALAIFYYCKAIEGGIVSWALVESYQLGNLLQASLKQEIKYAKYYVEVTDSKVLKRLRNRLTKYEERLAREATG